jgi:hypothetical protein
MMVMVVVVMNSKRESNKDNTTHPPTKRNSPDKDGKRGVPRGNCSCMANRGGIA